MTKPTMHCENCAEFVVDIVGDEIRCMAGFRPRFYMPRYGTELPMKPVNDWGFKRRCNNHIQIPDGDEQENKQLLVEMGYRYYKY